MPACDTWNDIGNFQMVGGYIASDLNTVEWKYRKNPALGDILELLNWS